MYKVLISNSLFFGNKELFLNFLWVLYGEYFR